jgi:hypothetical protein
MADGNNRYNRRFSLKSAALDRMADFMAFRLGQATSVDENLFTERAWAKPNYQYSRSIPESTTDANPATSAPSANIMDLDGYSSVAGYVELGTIASVDIQLWILDEQNGKWYLASTASSLGHRGGFNFVDLARNHKCYLRSGTATGAGETISIVATGL